MTGIPRAIPLRAAAGLRFLACASGKETGRWLADEAQTGKAAARARRAARR